MPEARAGKAYRYQARTLWSMSDFNYGGRDTATLPEGALTFALAKGPPWLKVDGAKGLVTGTPKGAGTADVELTVTDGQGNADTQAFCITVADTP